MYPNNTYPYVHKDNTLKILLWVIIPVAILVILAVCAVGVSSYYINKGINKVTSNYNNYINDPENYKTFKNPKPFYKLEYLIGWDTKEVSNYSLSKSHIQTNLFFDSYSSKTSGPDAYIKVSVTDYTNTQEISAFADDAFNESKSVYEKGNIDNKQIRIGVGIEEARMNGGIAKLENSIIYYAINSNNTPIWKGKILVFHDDKYLYILEEVYRNDPFRSLENYSEILKTIESSFSLSRN